MPKPPLNEKERDHLIRSARDCVRHGHGQLKSFPGLMRRIIEERAWERRECLRTHKVFSLSSLKEFIEKPLMEGMGEDVATIRKLVADDPKVAAMVERELTGKHGGDRKSEEVKEIKSDNISVDKAEYGTGKSYTLRRLERDHPELFERVCNGELSANAAAIEAGIRKKKTPLEQLEHWWAKASEGERDEFIRETIRNAEPNT